MKKALSLFLAVWLTLFCAVAARAESEMVSIYTSYKIPSGTVRLTAHRGYSAAAPENTLPAFRLAGEYGFWGAECDTSPTADGVWIIMHDDTVDRTTDGEGRVADFTCEELGRLTIDAGNNVESYPNTKIPTLIEYLDVCKAYGMHAVIEIKGCAPVESLDSLAALLSAREEKEMFTIITFGQAHAARIKALMPATPVYLLLSGDLNEDYSAPIRFCVDNGLDGLDFCCNRGAECVKAVQDAGLKTMTWTVDWVGVAEELYQAGVRDFTTNSLLPAKPQGNVFQKLLWALRDFWYNAIRYVKNMVKK